MYFAFIVNTFKSNVKSGKALQTPQTYIMFSDVNTLLRNEQTGMSELAYNLIEQAKEPFHIIEEFASLSPKRKMLLCDHLFNEGRKAYQNTVKLLWPEANFDDMRKLEKFLELLKRTAH